MDEVRKWDGMGWDGRRWGEGSRVVAEWRCCRGQVPVVRTGVVAAVRRFGGGE